MITKPKPGVMINPLHPLSRGLVGCWLFNEGAGSLANDISGHGNHGRLVGMAPNVQGSGWGGGKYGRSLQFDGIDDYIDCGNDASLDITDEITINANIKSTDVNGAIISKQEAASGTGQPVFIVDLLDGKVRFFCYVGAVAKGLVITPTAINDGNWHDLSLTFNGTYWKIFENSIEVASVSDPITLELSSYPLYIGTRNNDNGFTNVAINDVRIYNRALSPFEVKQLYQDPFCNLMR